MLERKSKFLYQLNRFDLVSSMTLVLILLYSGDFWYLRVPVTIVATAAIMFQSLRFNNNLWFGFAVFLLAANFHNWYTIDNHKYLITYWCIALFLACLSQKPEITIAKSARLLIGFAFLFATFWKAISPDFLNGVFFHFTLLFDERFADVSAYLGQLSKENFAYNGRAIDALTVYNSPLQSVQLQSTKHIFIISQVITWWTFLLEGLITIAFLWKKDHFISRWRDFLLLTFVVTSYAVAPVIGFGSVLVIMGLAQSSNLRKNTVLLYVLTFFLLQIYTMPWSSILNFFFPK